MLVRRMEQLGLSCTGGENTKWYSHSRKQFDSFLKVKYTHHMTQQSQSHIIEKYKHMFIQNSVKNVLYLLCSALPKTGNNSNVPQRVNG